MEKRRNEQKCENVFEFDFTVVFLLFSSAPFLFLSFLFFSVLKTPFLFEPPSLYPPPTTEHTLFHFFRKTSSSCFTPAFYPFKNPNEGCGTICAPLVAHFVNFFSLSRSFTQVINSSTDKKNLQKFPRILPSRYNAAIFVVLSQKRGSRVIVVVFLLFFLFSLENFIRYFLRAGRKNTKF